MEQFGLAAPGFWQRQQAALMQPAAGVSCITGEGRGGGIWIVMSQKLSQNCL